MRTPIVPVVPSVVEPELSTNAPLRNPSSPAFAVMSEMAPLLAETLKPPRSATEPPLSLAAFVSPARSKTYPPSPASLTPTVAAIAPALPSAAGEPVAMKHSARIAFGAQPGTYGDATAHAGITSIHREQLDRTARALDAGPEVKSDLRAGGASSLSTDQFDATALVHRNVRTKAITAHQHHSTANTAVSAGTVTGRDQYTPAISKRLARSDQNMSTTRAPT